MNFCGFLFLLCSVCPKQRDNQIQTGEFFFYRKVSLTPELSWLESRANNARVMGTIVLGGNSSFIKYSLLTIVVKL